MNIITEAAKFVKDNHVNILKVGGMTLSIAGMVVTSIAGEMQQKIDIIEAVKNANIKPV